ncbi:MAG: hypothetical protein E5W82_10175 [Mesorhizobium sp.]|nr:MAG: hypothetical protein E5W82_10175 [Mesorhizobium sp.]
MAQTKIGAAKSVAAKAGVPLEEFLRRVDGGEKWCWSCRVWKERSSYSRDSSRHDGLCSKCQSCRRVKERVCTKGRPSAFKGRTHSAEARAMMSAAHRGNKGRVGTKHTPETKSRISALTRERTPRGADHYAWKDGAKERNKDDRRRPEYRVWRESIFERDGFACTKCGDDKGGNLRAHHIKSFADFPSLRFDVENGVTLCHPCHELEHFMPDSTRNARKLKRGERLWK